MKNDITGIVAPIFIGTTEALSVEIHGTPFSFGKGTVHLMPDPPHGYTCRKCGVWYMGPNGFHDCEDK